MTISKVSLIGIPVDLGAEALGVSMGPESLRFNGIIEKFTHVGLKVEDLGDIDCNYEDINKEISNLKNLKEIVRICEEVALKVEGQIKKGNKIVALGGDHTISIGTLSGASKALNGDLGLIYIDAHGDFNTDKTTLSGNIHGMSLSAVVGIGATELVDIYSKGAKVKLENALLVGASDLDPKEEELIKSTNLPTFDMMDILAKGFGDLFGMILDLSKRVNNIYVSFDLDVVDGVYAPGVGIPNTGGLTYREIMAIAKYIGEKCNVIGVDIVEYNPNRDIDHKTADLAIEVGARLLGFDYSAYTKYMDTQK